jgi:glycosyltransferase involved in cell wall biosynthesis
VVRATRDGGAVCVLGLASDRDLYPDAGPVLFAVEGSPLSPLVARLAHRLYRDWALPSATCVAVQNQEQADACTKLRLRNAVVPNIVLGPPDSLAGIEPERDVIWAGNVRAGRRSKGLEELAALAELLPEVSFTVAGTLDAPLLEGAIDRLCRLPNVVVTGALAHDKTQRRIAAHRLVINTSPSEGFSNVMLEGWSLGRPAVTLWVNPSGLLSGDRLGICGGGDLETMAAAVEALLREPRARAAMGERARAYVLETHAPDRVCERFELLAGLGDATRRRGLC